jgi:hypothetical protein
LKIEPMLALRGLRLGCNLILLVLVALLRSLSSGVATLTVAMVMGREMGTGPWLATSDSTTNSLKGVICIFNNIFIHNKVIL